MKKINFVLLLILLFVSCRDVNEINMERGFYYYKQNNINEAMREFNNIIYDLGQAESLNTRNRVLLARAYYNLGLSYSKLEDYNQATNYIETAIGLDPLSEYFNTLNLIKKN